MSKIPLNFPTAPTLASHISRFLIYNMTFALLPLLFTALVRGLGAVQAAPGVYAPELFIFGTVLSATALGDLTDESRIMGYATRVQWIKGLLLLGGFVSAACFGLFQYDAILGSANSNFRSNITGVALIISIVLLLSSLSAEYLVGRIRQERQ